MSVNDLPCKNCIEDGQLTLANGCSVMVIIACSCALDSISGERNLDFELGYVGDK